MEIFNINTTSAFFKKSLEIFRLQYENIPVYKEFCDHLNFDPEKARDVSDLPFLPVEFFKTHKICSSNNPAEAVFTSSGTTTTIPGKHYVTDLKLYNQSLLNSFTMNYESPDQYCFLALLPSYLEREGSSLVYMVKELMKYSGHPDNGFYLNEYEELIHKLNHIRQSDIKTILIGVSFALLDFSEHYQLDLSDIIVMETGGMKGRRKEFTRQELHNTLCERFNLKTVHSEYGMTELLTQAYSKGNGRYTCAPWMNIIIKDPHDPLTTIETGKPGLINIIDLANINSCSFIATSDLGRMHSDHSFEVLGRLDQSDLRGCNLLVS